MSTNKYSPDNSAIIDATGKPWPVETPHLVPLPDGIDEEKCGYLSMLNFFDGDRWTNYLVCDSTHWLARRPLPEVPKVKTQEQEDEEAFEEYWEAVLGDDALKKTHRFTFIAARKSARQCPAKPAA